MSRPLFIYYDPHYFHEGLAKAINSEFWKAPRIDASSGLLRSIAFGLSYISAVFRLPRNYDVYFCEGTYLIPALARKLGLLKKDAKIVNILASPLLYYFKIGRVSGIKRSFGKWLLKEVDLFVCVGKMEEELLHEMLPGAKSIITYPYLSKSFGKPRSRVPKLGGHRIICVGRKDAYYKGIDLVVKAFKKIRLEYPDSTLVVAGQFDNIDFETNLPGIDFIGATSNIAKEISQAALSVHLGRGDAFPVSTMESMCLGVPTIVSCDTGTKEIAQKIDKRLVVPLEQVAAANSILWYFGLSESKKVQLSRKAHSLIAKLDEKRVLSKFKKDMSSALKETA